MGNDARKALDELYREVKGISLLASCVGVLEWDERTYMPPKGAAHRAEQKALISGLTHERFTSPRIGDLLSEVESSDLVADRLSADAVNVRELRRQYDKLRKIPKSLVEELARVTTLAEQAWAEARRRSDVAAFLPWLEKVIALKRQQAEAVGYQDQPYDALLDDYEPAEKASNIRRLFDELKPALVDLLSKIRQSGKRPNESVLRGTFSTERQEIIGRIVAAAIGFDFQAGRLDTTTHPFCVGIGPGDTRITTRYDERQFTQSFFGVLHETGHALYDQGLDPQYYGLPMGESVSLSIHESQSRLWENFVGRSRFFWEYFFPWVQRLFWESLGNVTLDDFYLAINEVKPSFIRVEADEATYNLHILLRFEIEHDIFADRLAVEDIPIVWNERFREYFGLEVPNHAQGCLQDVHWSAGLIGYFPTYTLGNLYAAQFFAAAKKQLGDLDAAFARGQFADLLHWLREKIHRQGRRYRAAELVHQVTGEPLSHRYLVDYLRGKYGQLYGF